MLRTDRAGEARLMNTQASNEIRPVLYSGLTERLEALDTTATAAGNAVYTRAIKQIRNDVTSGMSLLQATRVSGLFPMFLLQMTSIGEESGTLDEMLGKVADQYEMQVDNAVDSISSLIEPMIMSILGILIGGLMVAMYLPIFMLVSVM